MPEKVFMKKWYPGSFVSEDYDVEVSPELIPARLENRCYAISFFKRTVTEIDGEELLGKQRDRTGTFFLNGELYDKDRVQRENTDGSNRILLSNMECNGWEYVIKTRFGQYLNFYPEKGDKIVRVIELNDGLILHPDEWENMPFDYFDEEFTQAVRQYELPEELFNV